MLAKRDVCPTKASASSTAVSSCPFLGAAGDVFLFNQSTRRRRPVSMLGTATRAAAAMPPLRGSSKALEISSRQAHAAEGAGD